MPGLLLVFGAVFWTAPHHYLLAAGYLLVLALAASAYLSDTRRLFPSMFKPARAIYLSLLGIAAVLLMVDGDHLSGLRPPKEEQARLDARPQGLDQAPISSLLQASDGVLFASTGGTWFRSADRGILWTPAFPVHAAGIVKLPRTGALIAAISKQGIMRSGDSGKSWQMLLPLDDRIPVHRSGSVYCTRQRRRLARGNWPGPVPQYRQRPLMDQTTCTAQA